MTIRAALHNARDTIKQSLVLHQQLMQNPEQTLEGMGWKATQEQQQAAVRRQLAAQEHHNTSQFPKRAYPMQDGVPGKLAFNLMRPDSRKLYLEQLSTPVAPDAQFPDAVVQPGGINLERLNKLFAGYAGGLRFMDKDDPVATEVANHMDGFDDRLDAKVRHQYENYSRHGFKDRQLAYPGQSEIAHLAADTADHAHKLFLEAGEIAPVGSAQRQKYADLATNLHQVKHNLRTAAIQLQMGSRAEYKEMQRNANPEASAATLRAGSESTGRYQVGLEGGYKYGIKNVGDVKGTIGVTSNKVVNRQVGRDFQSAVTDTSGGMVQAKGKIEGFNPGYAPSFELGGQASAGVGYGTSVKSKKASDIDQIQATLPILNRHSKNPQLNANSRKGYEVFTNAGNLVRKWITGSPREPATLSTYGITGDKLATGKNNEDIIQDTARPLDAHLPREQRGHFHRLMESSFPGVVARTNAIAQGEDPAEMLRQGAETLFSYSGHATPHNGGHTGAHNMHVQVVEKSARASGQVSTAPTSVKGAPDLNGIFPSGQLGVLATSKKTVNHRMKYGDFLELFSSEGKLPSDVFSGINATRQAYDQAARSRHIPDGTLHPFMRKVEEHGVSRRGGGAQFLDQHLPPEDRAMLGDPANIPPAIRENIAAMRTVDPATGQRQLTPTDAVRGLTEDARHLGGQYQRFYREALKGYHSTDPAVKAANYGAINDRYADGWYRLPRKPNPTKERNFLTDVRNVLDDAAVEQAAAMSAYRLVGARDLANAPQADKDAFKAALDEQVNAYNDLRKLSAADVLPTHIFEQKSGFNKMSSQVSAKSDDELRTWASADLGFLESDTKMDALIPLNAQGPLANPRAQMSARLQNQNDHLNGLRLAAQKTYAAEFAVPGPIASTAKAAYDMVKKSYEPDMTMLDLRPEHFEMPSVAEMAFNNKGLGIAYTTTVPKGAPKDTRGTWFEGKKPLQSVASISHYTTDQTNMKFSAGGKLVSHALNGGLLDVVYSRSTQERIPYATKFGHSPGDLALAMSQMEPMMVNKKNELLPAQEITDNFNKKENQYFKNALFSNLNPINRSHHIARESMLGIPRDYYTEWDAFSRGMGDVGDKIRSQARTAKHIAPNSKADPFALPPTEDYFDGLRAQAPRWEAFDPELDARLAKMKPDEQMAYFASDPTGRKMMQEFATQMKGLNDFNNLYKAADGSGYTTTVRDDFIRNIPIADPSAPPSAARVRWEDFKFAVQHAPGAERAAKRGYDLDDAAHIASSATINWSQLGPTQPPLAPVVPPAVPQAVAPQPVVPAAGPAAAAVAPVVPVAPVAPVAVVPPVAVADPAAAGPGSPVSVHSSVDSPQSPVGNQMPFAHAYADADSRSLTASNDQLNLMSPMAGAALNPGQAAINFPATTAQPTAFSNPVYDLSPFSQIGASVTTPYASPAAAAGFQQPAPLQPMLQPTMQPMSMQPMPQNLLQQPMEAQPQPQPQPQLQPQPQGQTPVSPAPLTTMF